MSWFGNEYKNKISEIKRKEQWNSENIDVSYELGRMEEYEREISKIMKVIEEYNDNKSKLNTHYNNALSIFSSGKTIIDRQQGIMSGEVHYYVRHFSDKIDEIQMNMRKRREKTEKDFAKIKTAIDKLKKRKEDLRIEFNRQYNICLEKLAK